MIYSLLVNIEIPQVARQWLGRGGVEVVFLLLSPLREGALTAAEQSTIASPISSKRGGYQALPKLAKFVMAAEINPAVGELLSTERTYVKDLKALVTIFMRPLQEKADGSNPILSRNQITEMFSNGIEYAPLSVSISFQSLTSLPFFFAPLFAFAHFSRGDFGGVCISFCSLVAVLTCSG